MTQNDLPDTSDGIGTGGRARPDRPVRLAEVAAAAGVSAATVSQVLNGRRPVAETTKRRVTDAVARLDYRPNQLARGLRTRRTNLAALVIPDITNPFYPVLARGMQDVLSAAGMHTMVSNDDAHGHAADFFADLIARGVDGIVTTCFHVTPDDLATVARSRVPLVRLGGWHRTSKDEHAQHDRLGDTVRSNDQQAASEAVQFLLRRGYRRIGVIGAGSVVGDQDLRTAGYREALLNNGIRLDESLIVAGDYGRKSGRTAMHTLLRSPDPPRAVFCVNDLMAIGALDAVHESGRRVPQDVAIVGFDDIDAASLVTPGLTTVKNPAYALGAACGNRLLDRIRDSRAPLTETLVPAELVIRDST